MAVNLTYACCDGKLVHIAAVSGRKEYRCPSCGEKVMARRGKVYAHHFAHQTDSKCAANPETILHLIAKQLIADNRRVILQFPLDSLGEDYAVLRNQANYLHMDHLAIELDEILDFYGFYNPEGHVEYRVDRFVGDVVFVDMDAKHDPPMVVEVLVTHAMEEEKKNRLAELQIPYIEVAPKQYEDRMNYYVTVCHIPEFLQMKEEQLKDELFAFVYKSYRDKLLKKFTDELVDNDLIVLAKREAIRQLQVELLDLNLRDHIDGRLYAKMVTIPASATKRYERHETVSSLAWPGKYLMCNQKYVNLEAGILYSLLTTLRAEGMAMEAFVEQGHNGRDRITGFNLRMPRTTITGEIMTSILKDMIQGLETGIEEVAGSEEDRLFY